MSATYGLHDFIDDVRDTLAREQPPDVALERLTPGFKRLLANRTFLTQQLKDIGIRSDEVCLHAESDDGFVVLARGDSDRKPSKGKSHAVVPHDHGPLWALYGIYEGSSNLQRWTPDASERGGTFPGLKLISQRHANTGEMDAIPPHSMHLPVHSPDAGTVIIVVYNGPLESVVRRGYVAAGKTVVDFQGVFPSLEVPRT